VFILGPDSLVANNCPVPSVFLEAVAFVLAQLLELYHIYICHCSILFLFPSLQTRHQTWPAGQLLIQGPLGEKNYITVCHVVIGIFDSGTKTKITVFFQEQERNVSYNYNILKNMRKCNYFLQERGQ
jgi:hypothetical protein